MSMWTRTKWTFFWGIVYIVLDAEFVNQSLKVQNRETYFPHSLLKVNTEPPGASSPIKAMKWNVALLESQEVCLVGRDLFYVLRHGCRETQEKYRELNTIN